MTTFGGHESSRDNFVVELLVYPGEFDIADEDRSIKENEREEEDDDLEVDVTTVQPITSTTYNEYYSSDEEKDNDEILLYLPIAPEVEEPKDSGILRRKG